MNILAKNFLVYGTGLSGTSAVSFLLSRGAKNVYIYDDNKKVEISDTTTLENLDNIAALNLECVILSPGVQILGNENIQKFIDNNIDFISEFALGFEYVQGKKICVTGTNGKTTTVNLIYEMCKQKFKNVFLCGNTKIPITKIANLTSKDSIVICEVSSFALETAKDVKPYVSSILNITKDHLNRHQTFENYTKIKSKITKVQDKDDYFVCLDSFDIKTDATIVNYSLNDKSSGAYLQNNFICYKNKKIINKDQINLIGEKNLENILCAVTISKLLKVKNRQIKKVLKEFKGLKHRLQKVMVKDNITYIDDSKATNPDSTIFALNSFNNKIILLLGGSDKGYSYDDVFQYCFNVKKILTFGQMAEKIKMAALQNNFEQVVSFDKMKEAVEYATKIAENGDVVLFSPACASFDEFNSYDERGNEFIKIIKEINEKN